MVEIDLPIILGGIALLLGMSFVQGIGYAWANHWWEKHKIAEKADKVEESSKGLIRTVLAWIRDKQSV